MGQSWKNKDLVPALMKTITNEVVIKGIERGLQNLVNAEPRFAPEEEKVNDEMNALVK